MVFKSFPLPFPDLLPSLFHFPLPSFRFQYFSFQLQLSGLRVLNPSGAYGRQMILLHFGRDRTLLETLVFE